MKLPDTDNIKDTVNNWSPEALDKLLRTKPSYSMDGIVFKSLVAWLVVKMKDDILQNVPGLPEEVGSRLGNRKQTDISREIEFNDELVFGQTDPTAQQRTSLYFQAYKATIEGTEILEVFSLLCPADQCKSFEVINEIAEGIAHAIAYTGAKQPKRKRGAASGENFVYKEVAIACMLLGYKINSGKNGQVDSLLTISSWKAFYEQYGRISRMMMPAECIAMERGTVINFLARILNDNKIYQTGSNRLKALKKVRILIGKNPPNAESAKKAFNLMYELIKKDQDQEKNKEKWLSEDIRFNDQK